MQFLNFEKNASELKVMNPLVYLHGTVASENAKIIKVNADQEWPVVGKEWKMFIMVNQGENKFVFKCEDKMKEVTIHYVKEVNKRFILPIYIICQNSDGSFITPNGVHNTIEDALKKIKLNVRLIQTYFAESLFEYGFKRKSFYVAEDLNGEPEVSTFVSSLEIGDTMNMKPDDLYAYFHRELSAKLPNNPHCKYLCFMSCTRYFPPAGKEPFAVSELMSFVRGHAALGGGNMALFGTGSFHTWASTLQELTEKFSDGTVIDRTKMFDDSCGRCSHWANYSTTLGATVHELGHCFDLAHTKHGIMCRGHDDMNCFYTVVQSFDEESIVAENPVASPIPTKKVCLGSATRAPHGETMHQPESAEKEKEIRSNRVDDTQFGNQETDADAVGNQTIMLSNEEDVAAVGNQTIMLDDTGKYKGAHWYRSSAVLLNHHKWFNCYCDDEDDEDASKSKVVVSLHPNLLGPVGNMGTSAQSNQVQFNTKQWLNQNDLTTIVGVVFYYTDYLEALQFHGARYIMVDGSYECEGDISNSPIYGSPSQNCSKVIFPLTAPYERITSITLRAGAWIDGIQLTTNLKSSNWIGGKGGDVTRYNIQNGRGIESWIGSARKYVGSLAFLLASIVDDEQKSEDICTSDSSINIVTFSSPNGLRLIEFYDNNNGEVCHFKDFSHDPPPRSIDLDLKAVERRADEAISGTAWDDQGNKMDFRFDQTVFDILKSLS